MQSSRDGLAIQKPDKEKRRVVIFLGEGELFTDKHAEV